MPSTTNTKSRSQGTIVESGEFGAPGLERCASRRRTPCSAVAASLSQELIDDAADRMRLGSRLELPDGGWVSDEVIDQLLAGAKTEEEIGGPGGLLAQLTKRLIERRGPGD